MNLDVSLVIPVFNEALNIENLVRSLSDYFSGQKICAEVLFVDDGSTDESVVLLKNQKHCHYLPKLIRLGGNFGSHAAIRAGIMHAQGDRISCISADLQDPLELVGRLHEKCLGGYSIVFAARESTQGAFWDRFFPRVYARLIRWTLYKDFPANGFDIVMFDTAVKRELDLHVKKNASLFLQILRTPFAKSFIFYRKQERRAGLSKWTLQKKIRLFFYSFFEGGDVKEGEKIFEIAEIAELSRA